jgi:hypothetical protein
MSRQYSPKTFLRQVPNQLLKDYFDRQNLLSDVLWYLQNETEVEIIYGAWQALPEADRQAVEKDFQDIHDMACEEGIKALIEEGQFHGVDLSRQLDRLEGFHYKAMWAYLHHEQIFCVASLFNYVESLHGRYWVRRTDMPCKEPANSADNLQILEDTLSAYYRRTQGRGHCCTVENYLRGGRQHYYFVYLDDYTGIYIGHSADGRLIRRTQKQAFEIVFVYDREEGNLELHARGDKQLRTDLQQIFAMVILGEPLGPEQPAGLAYELNGLKDRGFRFPTDPEDGIEEVRIRKLRLSIIGNYSRRIILEADPKGPAEDIHDLMDECLARELPSAHVFHVTQATIEFRFAPRGNERPRKLVVDVSFPNCSNLKSGRDELRLLAEKYLKRWGIDRA